MGKSLKLIIEALLFASDKPLSASDIHSCLSDVKGDDIKSALRVLQYEYEALGRSFGLKEVAGGYQFRSRSAYGPYILKMLESSPTRLSRASMETLAIIAYKQPILRQEIERLRGVDVGGILRSLLEKGLIRIMGRKDLPGRPLVYGTSKKFLEVFDLKDIHSLPKLKEIKALGTEEDEAAPAETEEAGEEEARDQGTDQDTPPREPAEEEAEDRGASGDTPTKETGEEEAGAHGTEEDTSKEAAN
ncbi:MAG: SMC-Scp complex subunit ScpB [Desulfobacteraceae bacterium]|jgi:segregation and condensation protein B